MPSPIGHLLAGLVVAWSAEPPTAAQRLRQALVRPLTLVCLALAVLPDVDLLYPPLHRSATHSIGATLLVTIIAAGVTARVTGRINGRAVLACTAAYATHLVTDWMGTDRTFAPFGIQLLWPFDQTWYVSGWDVFLRVERRHPFSMAAIRTNLAAATREIAILGSIVAAIWLTARWRRSPSSRGPRESSAADPAARDHA
jgi:membrane-bound metal-dependent hydrolase YbcI (DUF457 family)